MAATPRDITHAYRMLAAKWHPDKWATATEDKQKVRTVAASVRACVAMRSRALLHAVSWLSSASASYRRRTTRFATR